MNSTDIIYGFCELPECHEMYPMRASQVGYKIYCSTKCWRHAQREKNPVTKCGLCRIEFPPVGNETFCSEQCYQFRNLFTRRMIQESQVPGRKRWRKFLLNRYGYHGRVRKLVW